MSRTNSLHKYILLAFVGATIGTTTITIRRLNTSIRDSEVKLQKIQSDFDTEAKKIVTNFETDLDDIVKNFAAGVDKFPTSPWEFLWNTRKPHTPQSR